MNILIQALQQFEGTFITVSHDRYFISQIANKIWWIENDEVKEYLGTYDEWKYFMAQREKNTQAAPVAKVVKPIEKAPEAAPVNSGNDKLRKQLQKQVDEIEKELEVLKAEKLRVENLIADPANNHQIGTLSEQYKQLEESLKSKNANFETIFEQLLSL